MTSTDTPILGFTSDQAAHLTGLSKRQLAYWDKTLFFSPTLPKLERRVFGRIYNFRDIVGLRTIAKLRQVHHIPLQELRRVGVWLSERHATPWASLKLYVAGRDVYFEDPATAQPTSTKVRGQTVMKIELVEIASETMEAVKRFRERSDQDIGTIAQNRYVVRNQPVISGTRVPTIAVWHLYCAGYSDADVIREYPRLTKEDVAAAIEFERSRRADQAI